MAERSRVASDAETLIVREVERFQQKLRTVNVAPVIVALQQQAEETRKAELRKMQSRLGSLSPDQVAAVEALTRSLVNKFLHPPMQALKQAAREGNSARVDALCEAWSVPVAGEPIPDPIVFISGEEPENSVDEKAKAPAETGTRVESHR
jgi:glutamyl-tRNA reductase